MQSQNHVISCYHVEDSDLDLNWLFSSGNDSLHDQTISLGDLSMAFNNDCENADETAFGFHELDDDIDINIEFAGPSMQRNELTPVKSTQDTPAPLTPATRQRKSRIAKEHTAYVQSLELTPEDQVEFLTFSLKQLGIYDLFKFERKPTIKGCKMIPIETRQSAWDFWHNPEFITESTLTSRPAKFRVADQSKI